MAISSKPTSGPGLGFVDNLIQHWDSSIATKIDAGCCAKLPCGHHRPRRSRR
jgi:hypothetical protein